MGKCVETNNGRNCNGIQGFTGERGQGGFMPFEIGIFISIGLCLWILCGIGFWKVRKWRQREVLRKIEEDISPEVQLTEEEEKSNPDLEVL